MQTERRVAANPQTKPTDLGCESAERLVLPIRRHHRHQLVSWYSLYRPTEGGRLSRPKHYSKGAQPVPKAVYRSDCRDKHDRPRWASNLGPLAPQSGELPLSHRDLQGCTNLIKISPQTIAMWSGPDYPMCTMCKCTGGPTTLQVPPQRKRENCGGPFKTAHTAQIG